MEGKHIKNDHFYPIIRFRKGQMFLAKSNSMARLPIIGILQYWCQHSDIICLPIGIAVTIVELFPKLRRKLENDRITDSICGTVRSPNVDITEMTTVFRHACSCIMCLCKEKRGKFSAGGARTAQSFQYCRG